MSWWRLSAMRAGESSSIERMFAPQSTGSTAPVRVLGIDPGLTRCGYAVLAPVSNTLIETVSLGVIRTSPSDDVSSRLATLLDAA